MNGRHRLVLIHRRFSSLGRCGRRANEKPNAFFGWLVGVVSSRRARGEAAAWRCLALGRVEISRPTCKFTSTYPRYELVIVACEPTAAVRLDCIPLVEPRSALRPQQRGRRAVLVVSVVAFWRLIWGCRVVRHPKPSTPSEGVVTVAGGHNLADRKIRGRKSRGNAVWRVFGVGCSCILETTNSNNAFVRVRMVEVTS